MTLLKTKSGFGPGEIVDQVFDTFFDWQLPARFTYTGTPLDLYEADGKYVIEMAAPGFEPKEINVEISGGTVTVTGERFEKTERAEYKYHRREMRHGAFSRTITLPQDLDANAVVATIDKGILRVELTPVKPIAPKKIEVKTV